MKRGRLPAVVFAIVVGLAGVARAEIVAEGNLLVTFNGGISPHALPRTDTAPVAVSIDTSFRTSDGSDPPQLQQVSIAINRNGKIVDRGLPICRVRKIQPATIAAARRICGGAIVGRGHIQVRVRLPNQEPFTFKGPMLVFNAERSGGKRQLLAQVYGLRPPSAFVLRFKVLEQKGTFGTVIRTRLPQAAEKWAYVTHFGMRLRRIYTYRGKQYSFVNAGCSAPAGFPGAVYPFARANFTFGDGKAVTSTLVRSCAVRSG
ncbi:MAG: hypothetical protein WBM00_00590 [Solirubrobacterales bacterium]